MNNFVRAITAIVGGLMILIQLNTTMNMHGISVLGLVGLVAGILLLLFAINPKVLETKHWYKFWK